ncbi:sensor histidine kinase [Rhizobium sp. FY34]|uniref:sensor histidine kinase n=1 Tax=Rhizobium sp. FY34 TaxID=2562309 RepID=UPI001FEEC8C3|nr:sensor histidine kinase [Rhizobium sp. FY34]
MSVDIALNPILLETSERAVILSITDAAPRERAELAEVFVKEVTHRARNMFAIIGAISRQISKHTSTVPEFQEALQMRLQSLSTSYEVFEKENWRAAPIDDLIRSQISFVVKQDIAQIDIAGPEIRLQAAQAECLGLAIHELATNAVKHGALSVPAGEISIRWSVDERDKIFQFHWSGLTVLAPAVERACYVHDDPLSSGLLTPATLPWLQRRFNDWNVDTTPAPPCSRHPTRFDLMADQPTWVFRPTLPLFHVALSDPEITVCSTSASAPPERRPAAVMLIGLEVK